MAISNPRLLALWTVGAVLGGVLLAAVPAAASGAVGDVLAAPGKPVAGSFVVVLNDKTAKAAAQDIVDVYGSRITAHWETAVHGFAARLSDEQAKRLAADPRVAAVWQDGYTHLTDIQPGPPSWGLDRIDQRATALDSGFVHNARAAGVHAYILDSGIRTTHGAVGGRAI